MAKIVKNKLSNEVLTVGITDTHLREDNIPLVKQIFQQTIDWCKKLGIWEFFMFGDLFHSRKAQTLELQQAFLSILNMIHANQMKMHIIPGNHDKTNYKSEESFLDPFMHHPGMHLVTKYSKVVIGGVGFHMIPFFDEKETYPKYFADALSIANFDENKHVLITHVGINQVPLQNGRVYENTIDSLSFKKFDKVLIGHFHDVSKIRNIDYVGAAYQQNYGENADKGPIAINCNLTWHRLKVDFPKYIKYECKANQLGDAEVLTDLKREIAAGNYVRANVTGTEAELKSFNFKTLQDSGVDINFKQESVLEEEQDMQVELQEFTDEVIGENFIQFCLRNKLSLFEGAQYLEKINIKISTEQ